MTEELPDDQEQYTAGCRGDAAGADERGPEGWAGEWIRLAGDDPIHLAPAAYEDQALQYLGLGYTPQYDGDFSGFDYDLDYNGSWDIVIMADDNFFIDSQTMNDLNTYAASGGKLAFHSWKVSTYLGNAPFNTLGLTWVADNTEPPQPAYWWQPSHPMFTTPDSVPQFTQLSSIPYPGRYWSAASRAHRSISVESISQPQQHRPQMH